MSGAPCEVVDCDRERRGHGAYCNKHRQVVRKHGDPMYRRYAGLATRMEQFIDRTGECWVWTGVLSAGYGQIWDKGRMRLVHRLMYELMVGPIPDGLVIDHLCRNPRCCNPAHIEPVTQKVNVKRGLHGDLRKELRS